MFHSYDNLAFTCHVSVQFERFLPRPMSHFTKGKRKIPSNIQDIQPASDITTV